MHDNNNNIAIANELEDIALQLAMLDSTDIKSALETVVMELQRIEMLAQLLEVPALESVNSWMILNTAINEKNEKQLHFLLSEGHFSNWIDMLAALLREQDSSLVTSLITELTDTKWPSPLSETSLKMLNQWLNTSVTNRENNTNDTVNSDEKIIKADALNTLSSANSIHQPSFETEKTSVNLFENSSHVNSIDDLLVNTERSTNDDLAILAELSGATPNQEEFEGSIEIDIIDMVDDIPENEVIQTEVKLNQEHSPNEDDKHALVNEDSITANQIDSNHTALSSFTAEVDDIIMTLATISESPEDIFNNTDKYSAELQRLHLLSELTNYAAIAKASDWCEKNIQTFSTKKSAESTNFIASGECWTWLELTNASLNNPDDISLLPAVTAELMREDWAEVFPIEDLESFILFLQNPEADQSLLINDSLNDSSQEQSSPELDTVINEEGDNELTLKWDDDVHPELLSVFLQETPDQVSEVAALLLTISKGEADKDQHQHAARIAHTIKGASGVVGIDALVQFTHKLEDILDYSVMHKLPTETADLLAEASDCLESLFEAVQDQQTAPEDFLPILEKLTESAKTLASDENETTENELDMPELPDFITNSNKLDDDINPEKHLAEKTEKQNIDNSSIQESTSEISATASNNQKTTPVFAQTANTTNTTTVPPKEQTKVSEAHVRVPLSIIDTLLNLAGELSITATRVSDELNKAIETNKLTKQQDVKVHEMLNELSNTISQQEKNQNKTVNTQKTNSLDSLEMDSYNELHSISGLLTESILDGEAIESKLTLQLQELSSHLNRQGQLNKELSEVILNSRMVSIDSLVPRLERTVRQTCRTTGKKAKLIITGNNINVDNDIINGLTDPLLHLLRNSVDHGIEDSQQRTKQNKKEQGVINLDFSRQGNFIVMKLKDDGAGINPDKIYQRAIDKGLITPEQSFSKDEALKLILLPGFTTQDSISNISGRGVGMDVVKTNVEKLKGTIDIESTPKKGSTFTIKIPLTLVTSGTLLLETANNRVALPVDSIEQLTYLTPKEVIHKNNAHYIKYNKKDIVIQALPNLLSWPATEIDYSKAQNIIIVKSNNKIHAVHVEKIINSRELVIKTLDPWFTNRKGIIGACHLADGSVAPVINLPQLLENDTSGTNKNNATKQLIEAAPVTTQARPQILVVDDSLSNRKALSLIIEQLDYDVLTAVDGLDALNIINDKHIDMVFTDLEMPRMNGLELTQAIRVWDDKKDLPIVMVTSRTTKKHQDLATKAGVDDYLTKPVITEDLHAAMDTWLKTTSLA